MSKRHWALCVVAILGLFATAYRIWGEVVPRGASTLPWLFASVKGPVLEQPDGPRSFRVYFNDAGAAHSGHHWTWVVEYQAMRGWVVVSEGYLASRHAVAGAPIPVEWSEEGHPLIDFVASRQSALPSRVGPLE